MAKLIYSYDVADAAMCIWEEITSPSLNLEPWNAYRETWGSAGLRYAVLTKLASACHDAWVRAVERSNHELPDGSFAGDDPGYFDWEFVPFWLTNCVDWSGEHPRVRGGVGVNERTEALIAEMS